MSKDHVRIAPPDPLLSVMRACRLVRPDLMGWRPLVERERLADLALTEGGHDDRETARLLADELIRSDASPLDGLFRLAEQLVDFDEGAPYTPHGTVWHQVIRQIDSDLLVAARLAGWEPPPANGPELVRALAWPSVLRENSFLIEEVAGRELADVHVHLGGALPPSFYWIAAMSGLAHLYRMAGWSEGDEVGLWPQLVDEARRRRNALAERLAIRLPRADWPAADGGDTSLEAFVDPILRALEPSQTERVRRNPILGERYLLWLSLATVRHGSFLERGDALVAPGRPQAGGQSSGAEAPQPLDRELLAYLEVRNAFQRFLVYHATHRGLDSFIRTFRRQHLVAPDTTAGTRRSNRRRRRAVRAVLCFERFRMRHSLRYQFSDPTDAPWARDYGAELAPTRGEPEDVPESPWRPPRQVELRVTPVVAPLQSRVLLAYLLGIRDFVEYDRDAPLLRVGLVFHFLKGEDATQVSETARWQAEGIACLLESQAAFRRFVVGIDAAGHERYTAPRDFSRAYRLIRDRIKKSRSPGRAPVHLGRTYHAGEDFRDLLTGLRHMDDAICLLDLEPGDRLGHGLALGIEPKRWYVHRTTTYPSRGEHALDLVWGIHLARVANPACSLHSDELLAQRLEARLEELLRRHGSALDRGRMRDLAYWAVTEPAVTGEARPALLFPSESRLLAELGVTGPERLEPLPIDATWVDIVVALRERVLARVEAAEIVIEACPTSNLLIGGFGSYAELPYLALNRLHLPPEDRVGGTDGDAAIRDPQIPLCLASDDPGMFQTTIANEYRLMGRGLLARGFRRRDVVEWLEEARRVGVACTFIPPWSPPTRRELSRAIGAVERGELM